MAKKQLKEKSIEETLWESANKLLGSVEYKYTVLSLKSFKSTNSILREWGIAN